MTLPGLALFYGGLVRRKNVLSVLAQCLGIAGLVTILWWAVRLQHRFPQRRNPSGAAWIGPFCTGVDSNPNTDYGAWVSHNVFSMYQLMFAIITPALIVGAIAERMKFSAILLFVTLVDVRRLFPARPHGLGRGRFDERRLERSRQDQSDRFRRRHRGAYVLRLVGA